MSRAEEKTTGFAISTGAAYADEHELDRRGDFGNLSFALVWFFTFVAFGRPEDLFPSLGTLHLTLVSGLSATAACLGGVLSGRARLVWPRELILVLLLTAWFVIGLPFAQWRGGSFNVLTQEWARTLLFFFLLAQSLSTVGRVRKILWAVFLGELISSSVSVIFRSNPNFQAGDRLSGINQGFLGWNFLGITFSVTLPFLAALYVAKRSAFRAIVLILVLGSTMWMLVLTASRGGFIGVVVSIVMTWWFVLRDSSRGRRVAMMLPICLLIALLAAPGVFWSRLHAVVGSSESTTNLDTASAEESTRGREILLENSLKYTAEFPIFGLGMGGFPIYNGRRMNRSDAWLGTHNTFTQLSSEGGLPALVLFLFLYGTALSRMRKVAVQCTTDAESTELRLLARAARVSLWAFGFNAFLAHIAYEYLFYYIAGIAVGVWAIYRKRLVVKARSSVFPAQQPSLLYSRLSPKWN